jgi:hypothetical protein
MRKYLFDEFEFEDRVPEEEVEVIISTSENPAHRTLARFADDVIADGVSRRFREPLAFFAVPDFPFHRRRLAMIASIAVEEQCNWPCYVVEDDDPLWWRCVLDAGNAFISYRWSSSA